MIVVALVLMSGCAPKIYFKLDSIKTEKPKLFIGDIQDLRPVNERQGYKIFYIKSINDEDYKKGFMIEFKNGLFKSLERPFEIVSQADDADYRLTVKVSHFYGEFSHTVKTVFYEYCAYTCLFIPRLITDFIPYNAFAGRVAMELTFKKKNGETAGKTIDLNVAEKVSTWHRHNGYVTKKLCQAAAPEIDQAVNALLK